MIGWWRAAQTSARLQATCYVALVGGWVLTVVGSLGETRLDRFLWALGWVCYAVALACAREARTMRREEREAVDGGNHGGGG